MSEQVTVSELPSCDFCSMRGETTPATYDFKTSRGPWANGCESHWKEWRASSALGTGHGQKLVVDNGEADEIKIVIVPESKCPGCGGGDEFNNRPKVSLDGTTWWWRCYNQACPVAYYEPITGAVEKAS